MFTLHVLLLPVAIQCLENAPVRLAGLACSAMKPVHMVIMEPTVRSHVCASMGDPAIVKVVLASVRLDFQ